MLSRVCVHIPYPQGRACWQESRTRSVGGVRTERCTGSSAPSGQCAVPALQQQTHALGYIHTVPKRKQQRKFSLMFEIFFDLIR